MAKGRAIVFSLVCFLIGISCIKPVSVAACMCVQLGDGSAGRPYKCIKNSDPLGTWDCPTDTDGRCVSPNCVPQAPPTNKQGNNPTFNRCKCNDKGPIDPENYCDNAPTKPGAIPSDAVCILDNSKTNDWSCKCMTPAEKDKWDSEQVAKSQIGATRNEDPYCTSTGFGINKGDVDKSDIKVSTALGCVPINFIDFVKWIFDNGFGIVGGIAFLLLIGAFIQLATSEGDVKKIQGVKETITSIVTGLLLAIFSIFIIRMLMITILRIPGLQ